jgi:hypothetical protein
MKTRPTISIERLQEIISERGGVRKLLIDYPNKLVGNALVVRCVGFMLPFTVSDYPNVMGKYNVPTTNEVREIFQPSSLKVGEYFRFGLRGAERLKVVMNEITLPTETTPAITEFVAIRD